MCGVMSITPANSHTLSHADFYLVIEGMMEELREQNEHRTKLEGREGGVFLWIPTSLHYL